MIRHTQQ